MHIDKRDCLTFGSPFGVSHHRFQNNELFHIFYLSYTRQSSALIATLDRQSSRKHFLFYPVQECPPSRFINHVTPPSVHPASARKGKPSRPDLRSTWNVQLSKSSQQQQQQHPLVANGRLLPSSPDTRSRRCQVTLFFFFWLPLAGGSPPQTKTHTHIHTYAYSHNCCTRQ
jgi:hypothetical protein